MLLQNGNVWIVGGNDNDFVPTAELYDHTAKTFSVSGSLAAGRYWHAVALLQNGKVFVTGGVGAAGILASSELYDPTSGTCTSTGNLATARMFARAVTLRNGEVLVIGGFNGIELSSCELYSPTTGTCSATGSMNVARSEFTATLLADGRVWAAGGVTSDGTPEGSSEIYDPDTGAWTLSGNLVTARYAHCANLLPGGSVLLIGGSDGGPIANAEIWNPATGSCAATASLGQARLAFASTILNDGRVYACGGQASAFLASAEIFSDFVLSLAYVSSTPITGAVEDWLSALGNERGCIRQDGEDGEAYRARVRMIPDAVSPLAIARAVDATATALPERWLAEPFNDGADPNVKLAANLGFFDGFFCDADFCDDPLGTPLADKQPAGGEPRMFRYSREPRLCAGRPRRAVTRARRLRAVLRRRFL